MLGACAFPASLCQVRLKQVAGTVYPCVPAGSRAFPRSPTHLPQSKAGRLCPGPSEIPVPFQAPRSRQNWTDSPGRCRMGASPPPGAHCGLRAQGGPTPPTSPWSEGRLPGGAFVSHCSTFHTISPCSASPLLCPVHPCHFAQVPPSRAQGSCSTACILSSPSSTYHRHSPGCAVTY